MIARAGDGSADLAFSDVHFSYPGREEEVLHGVDLSVPAGQRLALVGLNGAGKSTMVKLLCGLLTPGSGQVSVGGEPVTGPDGRVAAIFQNFERYPLSLRDNVMIGAADLADEASANEVAEVALRRAAAEGVIERVGEGGSTHDALARPLSGD